MALNKYGVENRKELLEKELEEVREKLKRPMSKVASPDENEYLEQREKDILEALEHV
jgi:hypothetical protein